MGDANHEVWTAEDVRAFVRLNTLDAVYALAPKLGGVKVGKFWRFDPAKVRAFIRGEALPSPAAPASPSAPATLSPAVIEMLRTAKRHEPRARRAASQVA